ncbi:MULTISPECIES: hypothetical protein [Bacillaceae]|uniref:Preprotein translocase subunit Tim44 n=1 Tax=Metabacillus sediminis TaxID=3117746 RepID=A0ABZ2NLP7_9BACI|nr:hypothetical protein [Bacillus sp. SJS]KZZ82903.1 hypothetical protein AS29_019085 [Bacillus sp. SJS]
MMKKLIAAMTAAALLFTPVTNLIPDQGVKTVEAKGFKKSGGFGNRSSILDKKPQVNKYNNSKNSAVSKAKNRSLMKGLIAGGLAGLLFGSLLANMGIFGSIIGFLINVIGIFILLYAIRKIYQLVKRRRVYHQ